ncbi:DUF5999 family protein [Streptomyces nigrescens]|uniref:DUF5999 family protein n=1 Tax=Streptomyces nigrescens TaxID=1920 RepID=A0ABY7IYK4_STRNI|nr:DUF5999 family protein [Streptomyces nigrescens]WAU04005.1 DUF5999 family protein [Streptomyces nigrescens]
MCLHRPQCPGPDATDREAAHVRVQHPEQGWSLLCNGVVLLHDTGAILPDGRSVAPNRIGNRRTRSGQSVLSGGHQPSVRYA